MVRAVHVVGPSDLRAALATLASTAKRPLVMTSNAEHVPGLEGVLDHAVRFAPPPRSSLVCHLALACLAEGCPLPAESVAALVDQCAGDMRRAFATAQLVAPAAAAALPGQSLASSPPSPQKCTSAMTRLATLATRSLAAASLLGRSPPPRY
eukprot:904169-Prorocentrum_minimum.AAC.1